MVRAPWERGKNDGRGGIDSYYDASFSVADMPSAIKSFVEPGEEFLELVMRADFKDEAERTSCVLLYSWYAKYKLKEKQDQLLLWVAAGVSLKGKRTHELLQAVVGQLDGLPKRAGIRDKIKKAQAQEKGDIE